MLTALLLVTLVARSGAAQPTAADISRETRHLKFTARLTPRVIKSGQPLIVSVDIAPKRGMHVYAPGSKYRPIAVTFEPQPALTIDEPIYPPATPYYFKPLKETVHVYQSAFQLLVKMRTGAAARHRSIVLKGALEYQACDDRVCYLPESIPLLWTVRVDE
ncbi:MAG TPA: protein-disulfide reductase DsbD domain-containing protein [Vicinamibacterales bacterium]|nr:protein-disulfide reductase DsbD domain-containing protein [Vicinamibacterales bacterium]